MKEQARNDVPSLFSTSCGNSQCLLAVRCLGVAIAGFNLQSHDLVGPLKQGGAHSPVAADSCLSRKVRHLK